MRLFRRSPRDRLASESFLHAAGASEPTPTERFEQALATEDWGGVADAVLALGEELSAALTRMPWEAPSAALAVALALRDRGRLKEADRLLRAIEKLEVGTDLYRQARFERLVINILWRFDSDHATKLVEQLNPGDLKDPRAALLRVIYLRRKGDNLETLRAFSTILAEPLHQDEFWAEKWFECLLWEMKLAENLLECVTRGGEAQLGRELIVRTLAVPASTALLHARGREMASSRLRALLALDVRAVAEVVCEAVLGLPAQGAIDAKAHGLSALLAFRFDGHLERFAARFLPDAQLERHPLLLEYVAAHPHAWRIAALARLAGELPETTRQALQMLVAERLGPYEHQARKLLARDAARHGEAAASGLSALPQTSHPSRRPPGERLHVFVGVFGQLRFPETSLSRLRAQLCADLAGLDAKLSFGLATWTKQGRRPLDLLDPAALALARLPHPLDQALEARRYANVFALANDLPATVALLQADACADPEISEHRLRETFGWRGGVALGDDDEFMANDGLAIVARCGSRAQVLNQGRMWNRLAALRNLSDQASKDEDQPIDIHLFIRADLKILGGSLAEGVRRALAMGSDRDLVVDHDGWAAFIEGFGDRYMICRPGAAERIYDGLRILLELMNPALGISPSYLTEMEGHTFPATLVFEDGGTALQLFRHEIEFEIDRGRLSFDTLAPELLRDRRASPSPEVRDLLDDLLVEFARA